MSAVLASLSGVAAAAVTTMTVAALVARRQRRVVVVDVAWGVALALSAVVAAVVGAAAATGDVWRAGLVAALVAIWGLRLSWHIHRRSGASEDPRYEHVLGGPLDDVGMAIAVRKVFLVQGAAVCLVALPVAVGAVVEVASWSVVAAGCGLWLLGVAFETVGDAQLATYRNKPRDARPPVLDTGLWRYTRHPNYFGDACVWWGLWMVAGLGSGVGVGLATIVAPATMTFFLIHATGARLLEHTMMQRPAYREYAARTSMFLPMPPRRAAKVRR